MAENYPENESTIITTEELQGIDINQVDSMQLKDGTVVLIKEGEEMDGQENNNQFVEEDQGQIYEECEDNLEDTESNQLRARPMMYPMRPRPLMPVAPMRPTVMKPMVVPSGPVRPVMPMGRVIFRGRPGTKNEGGFQQGGFGQPGFGGMGKQQGGYGQPGFGGMGMQQGGFGQPGFGGMGKQQGGFGQPGFGGMGKQQGGYGQPGFGGMGKQQGGFGPQQGGNNYKPQGNQKQTQRQQQTSNPFIPLNQQLQYPGYNPNQQQGDNFRARPNIEEEKETNFQEEEFGGEEEYYENNEQYQEDTENQLRARPLIVPGGRVVLAPGYAHRPKKVIPVMPGMGVRRGPTPKVVMGGFNSFQPRFRARPGRVMVANPMLTPINPTFRPKVVGRYGYGGVRPNPFKQGMRGFVPPPPIFRARPRSNSYNERDYDEQIYEEEYQFNTSYA